MGGPEFMSVLTILLIMMAAWMIYHFIAAYSKIPNQAKILRRLEYGKLIGLFALVTGLLGQLIGLSAMFDAVETGLAAGKEINHEHIYGGIKVTMIVTIYGILIYLFSLLLWFLATLLIERKLEKQSS